MTLVGIQALAVYAIAAALILFAASRWVRPIHGRVALALAAAPLLFTGRATVTGGVYAPLDILYGAAPFSALLGGPAPDARTPLLSDVVCSSIPWHAAVRDALTHGRWPLWNRFVLAGEPLLAVQQSAALHPATWLGLLLPLPQAWTLQMSLRLLVALLAAYLLVRELGAGEIASLAGAAAWAFSDFIVFWLGFSVANAIGPFPLLALGLLRLARDADFRAAALTSVSLALIVLGGHPEMLLFAVAAGGVWFLFRLAEAPPARRRRAVLLAAAAGAAALGATAIQLAPLVEAMPQTYERAFRDAVYAPMRKSVAPIVSARRAAVLALPFAYGVSGRGRLADGFGLPGAYAGAILFPLAWTGLLAPGRRALRASLAVLGLLGAALWARLAGPTDALAALPLFRIGVLDYMVFAAVFALAILAALGVERLARGDGRAAFLWAAAAAAAAIVSLYLARRPWMRELGMTDAFTGSRLAWELVPLAAGMLFAAFAGRPARGALAAVGCLAVLLVSRVAEAGGVYPTMPARAFYPPLPVLDAIPRGTPDRMTALGAMLVPNAAAVYGLEDARGYESMTFRPLVETYPLWSRQLGAWFNMVEDLRRPFLAFLNVRWAVVSAGTAPPPGWTVRARTPGADLLENKGALPRAFVPAFLRLEPDRLQRLKQLEGITDFWQRGLVSELIDLGTAREWFHNGDASV
ncbi:MAG TPA: hypothetical protein VH854_16905, partial [Thermoanaerobaculia bacterium]|nr:hypothetical protein [Thermoanaerobaculia bacterium]